MGFNLMQNFNFPYCSRSVTEFWKRWHISLSTWFRDYLYISLGGNRVNKARWYFNLFITFLVSGLWHGANLTFVLWGAINGLYLIMSIATQKARKALVEKTGLDAYPKLLHFIQTTTTFSMISFAWIFFRASNVHDAFYIGSHLFEGMYFNVLLPVLQGNFHVAVTYVCNECSSLGMSINGFVLCILLVLGMECVQYAYRNFKMDEKFMQLPISFRWTAYYAMIFALVYLGVYNDSPFIYFQF